MPEALDLPALALPVDRAAAGARPEPAPLPGHVLLHVWSIKIGTAHVVPVIKLGRWLYVKVIGDVAGTGTMVEGCTP